jgi:YesN/AraC family two-component response regulator
MRNHHFDTIEKTGSNIPSFQSKFSEMLEIELNEEFSIEKIESVRLALENAELFFLVEEVKTVVYQLINHSDKPINQSIQEYIGEKVNHNYILLNKLFLQSEGISIKRYINRQKIELVKDLLSDKNLSLTLIARNLQYRNITHLEDEFLNETGVSTDFYRLLRHENHKLQVCA